MKRTGIYVAEKYFNLQLFTLYLARTSFCGRGAAFPETEEDDQEDEEEQTGDTDNKSNLNQMCPERLIVASRENIYNNGIKSGIG